MKTYIITYLMDNEEYKAKILNYNILGAISLFYDEFDYFEIIKIYKV